jgi:hypothetical protein
VAAGFEFAAVSPAVGHRLENGTHSGERRACRLGGVVASWRLSNVNSLCHNRIRFLDSRLDLNALQRKASAHAEHVGAAAAARDPPLSLRGGARSATTLVRVTADAVDDPAAARWTPKSSTPPAARREAMRTTLKQARGAAWLHGRTSTPAIDQQLNRAWLVHYNSARSEVQQTKSVR